MKKFLSLSMAIIIALSTPISTNLKAEGFKKISTENTYVKVVDTTIKNNHHEYQATIKSAKKKKVTMGEKNALKRAKEYLSIMAFSKKGLIAQLKFDGFTKKQATYGVEHCGANWKKQAVKKAKEYLNVMSFSKSGLIEQLEYDGFTHSQAVYGVKKNGY